MERRQHEREVGRRGHLAAQMEDHPRLNVADELRRLRDVFQVALPPADAVAVCSLRAPRYRNHVRARGDELRAQMRAEEASGARDEHRRSRQAPRVAIRRRHQRSLPTRNSEACAPVTGGHGSAASARRKSG